MRDKLVRFACLPFLLLVFCGASAASWAQDARYAVTLSAAAGTASGRGDFSFDDLGRQLTYTIVYTAMPGTVTDAHLAGPTQGTVVLVLAVPQTASPAPLIGTTTLDEAQAGLLKAGKLFVAVRSSANGEIGGWITAR